MCAHHYHPGSYQLHPSATVLPQHLPTFKSQHHHQPAQQARVAPYTYQASTSGHAFSAAGSSYQATTGHYNASTSSSRPSSSGPVNAGNLRTVPMVTSNYGYGPAAAAAHLPADAVRSTPHRDASAASKATAYAQVMGDSLARARQRGAMSRGRGSSRGGQMSNTSKTLLSMAGYQNYFVKEGEQRQPPSGGGPVFSSRGRGFARPPAPHSRGRGVGRGGVGGPPRPRANPMAPSQPNVMDIGRSIQPRPASVCLAEVVGNNNCVYVKLDADDDDYEEFNEEHGYYPNFLHKMRLRVFDRSYVAVALAKKDVKERCAEKAFPDVLAVQVQAQRARPKQKDAVEKPVAFDHMEDEIPFAALCSMAIHKLYSDWQEEGFDIPDHLLEFRGAGKILHNAPPPSQFLAGGQSGNTSSQSQPIPTLPNQQGVSRQNLNFKYVDFQGPAGSQQAQIPMATSAQQARWGGRGGGGRGGRGGGGRRPDYMGGVGAYNPPVPGKLVEYPSGKVVNPVSKHPVVLLNELIPNLEYAQQAYGSRHSHFVTTIEVKGQSFTGESNNKKDSKVQAAVNALKGAFGIEYPAFPTQEDPMDTSY